MSKSCQFAKGVRVKPTSRAKLQEFAKLIRRVLKLESLLCFPVVHFLEFLQRTDDDFEFQIVENNELPKGMFACYNPFEGIVYITEKIYKMANDGNGFARWTILHECLHHLLHRDQLTALARQDNEPHKPYEDSEWQADALTCELLMPLDLINADMTEEEVAEQFGVSPLAARNRLENIRG